MAAAGGPSHQRRGRPGARNGPDTRAIQPSRRNLWLTGDALGWRGPWGTTYASNLRDKILKMSEAQWVQYARTAELRPPMPWFNLRAMRDADLKALYRFIVYLGPGGQSAPAYVPPDQEPKPPYVTFPAPPK